jgi:hypothetical protein
VGSTAGRGKGRVDVCVVEARAKRKSIHSWVCERMRAQAPHQHRKPWQRGGAIRLAGIAAATGGRKDSHKDGARHGVLSVRDDRENRRVSSNQRK